MKPRELPTEALSRRAIVYVRQSTGMQVRENLESQRRQYELVDLAREYGFSDVSVIDVSVRRVAFSDRVTTGATSSDAGVRASRG